MYSVKKTNALNFLFFKNFNIFFSLYKINAVFNFLAILAFDQVR